MVNNISIIIYTNETYYDLLEFTLPFLIENFKKINIKKYVVSNKIKQSSHFEVSEQIDCGVEFLSNGGHFEQTISYALENIKEDYILFLCDDYLIKSEVKYDILMGVFNFVIDNEIDYMSLGTQKHMEPFIFEWENFNIDYKKYGLPDKCLFKTDVNCRHLYSVQPCIWKKKSLIEILKNNKNITLHDLDNTNIKDLNGNYRELDEEKNFMFYKKNENYRNYDFKNVCIHYPIISYHVDEKPIDSDYFLLDYIEIVRHGKFLDAEVNSKYILNQKLNEKLNIKNKLLNFF